MPNLTSQMEAVCRRFEELSIRLNQPETAARVLFAGEDGIADCNIHIESFLSAHL